MARLNRGGKFLRGAKRAIGKIRRGVGKGQQILKGIDTIASSASEAVSGIQTGVGQIESAFKSSPSAPPRPTSSPGVGVGICNRSINGKRCTAPADHLHVAAARPAAEPVASASE